MEGTTSLNVISRVFLGGYLYSVFIMHLCVFIHNLYREEELKGSREKVGKLEIEILEREIIDLKGEVREKAMKTYRRLLLSLTSEPIYLMRSE
jgi:hypothetical protein